MAASVRRVVTGHNDQKRSVVLSDGVPETVFSELGLPDLRITEVWQTLEAPAQIKAGAKNPFSGPMQIDPPSRGTLIRIADIPPETPESLAKVSGADVFAKHGNASAATSSSGSPHPLMHRTATIDYGIVLEGEITLVLDTEERQLRAGDIVVQRGTNHAWSNRSGRNCRVAFIMVSGEFDPTIR
jgi:mannose-6-phosphate isomerase-like protein (cupin superfamily)